MKIKTPFIALLGLCGAACDDTTNDIGIYTEDDNISASTAVYEAVTRSLAADSVLSNSNSSFLGRMTDPETGLQVKAEFLAQFSTLENWEFPDYDLMVKNEEGKVEADSIEIRLYYEKYYGNGNNPMKIDVYELDSTNVIREDSTYYSNADLTQYINHRTNAPLVSKIFTATDFTLPEDELEDNPNPNIRIILPKAYGTFILQKYYENKDFFRNSYNFIHHVCPGFYFKLTDGNGTMVKMRVGAMNLYFRYKDEARDTVYAGMGRFAATPEVLQNTYVENDGLATWLDGHDECTYVKTPAGVFTEMTLPIDEIYQGHDNDSISQAQFTLYRYNAQAEDQETAFDIPQTLLLVRKKDMYSFFEESKVPDNKTSFVASFNRNYNTYTFSNISNLVAYCRKEKNEEAAKAGLTPEVWAQSHGDWNKVVLIPVETNLDNSNNIVSVTHDMGIGSARLVGGANDRIRLQVIYSTFR